MSGIGWSREVDVAVIGGGFSGIMAAARLKERGVGDVMLIESGADFGGTWYWNRYPGSQCDIESLLLPAAARGARLHAEGEILLRPRDLRALPADRRVLRSVRTVAFPDARDGTAVERGSVPVADRHPRGDDIRARFVIQAAGTANVPKLPGIEGIHDYRGHSFHTCRWDYDYTGGDQSGGLTKLADKRVAMIGTGCTSIQAVPFVGEHAGELYVFQRTPSSVDARGNMPTDEEWYRSLEPGWQRARRENFADIVVGRPFEEDLVADGWTDIFRRLQSVLPPEEAVEGDPEELAFAAEVEDFRKMNEIRSRVDKSVKDPAAREALKPWYRQFCKRPTFNDEYLATFNRPNVHLVDVSERKGVDRITEKGVVANGVEYEVDCIIYATGFEMTSAPHRRVNFDVYGRDGKSLFEHWDQGLRTMHGLSSHGFPNWFFIGVTRTGCR